MSESVEWTVKHGTGSNPMKRIMRGDQVIVGWTMGPFSESFQKIVDARNAEFIAAQKVCELYFNIAAEAIGEDEVRRKRDAALAKLGSRNQCRLAQESWFNRWILVDSEERLGWSGSRWVPIDGDMQISNFDTRSEAREYAANQGFEVLS